MSSSRTKPKFFLCLSALIFSLPIFYAQNADQNTEKLPEGIPVEKETKSENTGSWACEFGWNPPSFNCSPVKPGSSIQQIEEEVYKQQAEIVKVIQKKEAEVRKKELKLDKKQEELRNLEQRIERKLEEMRRLQSEIEKIRKEKIKEDAKDLDLLVQLYEKMEADSAAQIINTMDLQTSVNIILRMNPRKSSILLQSVNPETAKKITEEIAHIKANRATANSL